KRTQAQLNFRKDLNGGNHRSSLQKVIGTQTLRQFQLQGCQDAGLLGVSTKASRSRQANKIIEAWTGVPQKILALNESHALEVLLTAGVHATLALEAIANRLGHPSQCQSPVKFLGEGGHQNSR